MRLLIATGNAGKVKEIRHELEAAGLMGQLDAVGLKDLFPGGYEECVEDAETFAGNAVKKALHYSSLAGGMLTLADDSGLCVEALGGVPGVYSARYAGVTGPGADAANNAKLLRELGNVPPEKRQAKFVCSMALARNRQVLTAVEDDVHGVLLRQPRGTNGFGYDPLFYFPEFNKSTAELDMQAKGQISHRGKALRRMIAWMRAEIGGEGA